MISHRLISAYEIFSFCHKQWTGNLKDLTCVELDLPICLQNNRLSSDILGYEPYSDFGELDNFEVMYFPGAAFY